MDSNVLVPVTDNEVEEEVYRRGWLDVVVEDEHETLIDESVSDPYVTLTNIFPDANWAAMVIVNCLRVSAVYLTVSIDSAIEVNPLPSDRVALLDGVQDVMRMEYCDEDVPSLERPVFNSECAVPPLRIMAVDEVNVVLVNAPLSVSHETDSIPHPVSSDTPTGAT